MREALLPTGQDEEKGNPSTSTSLSQRNVKKEQAKEDDRTSLGEFYKLTDDQLKETIKHRIEQMDAGGDELEESEAKDFLKSTHYILFKITDYMSIPSVRLSDCSCTGVVDLFVSLMFGARQRDEKGRYDEKDQSRFLLLFHDPSCLYMVMCSLFVFTAQFLSINSILNSCWSKILECSDDKDDDCSPNRLCHDSEGASNFSVLLCILYAASQSVDDLLICIPFEIVGVSKEEYCFWVHQKISHGERPRPTYWWKTIRNFLNPNPEQKLQDIKNFIELCFAVVPSFLLIISNLYLVMCIAFIMATSSTTLDLVQNFIAVEILVQAHTIIARLMRIRDRSPTRFTKHWRWTLHELEKVKAVPIYCKNKDGTDGLRARLSYQRFNNIVFSVYALVIYLTYCSVLVYICGDDGVLTAS